MKAGFLTPLVRYPDGAFRLVNRHSGRIVATRIETAFDSDTRRRGLLGRSGLAEGTCLVIAPSNSVHTFFMRFPIDVVFVARDGRVAKVRRHVKPWRVAASLKAFAVIELAAGSGGAAGLRAGDVLEVVGTDSEGQRT